MFGQAVLRVHRSAPVFEVCPACSLTWTSAPLATLTTARPLCQPQFLWSAASSSLSHTSWQHEKNYVHVTLEGVVLAVMKKLSKSAIIFSRKTWTSEPDMFWHQVQHFWWHRAEVLRGWLINLRVDVDELWHMPLPWSCTIQTDVHIICIIMYHCHFTSQITIIQSCVFCFLHDAVFGPGDWQRSRGALSRYHY